MPLFPLFKGWCGLGSGELCGRLRAEAPGFDLFGLLMNEILYIVVPHLFRDILWHTEWVGYPD